MSAEEKVAAFRQHLDDLSARVVHVERWICGEDTRKIPPGSNEQIQIDLLALRRNIFQVQRIIRNEMKILEEKIKDLEKQNCPLLEKQKTPTENREGLLTQLKHTVWLQRIEEEVAILSKQVRELQNEHGTVYQGSSED